MTPVAGSRSLVGRGIAVQYPGLGFRVLRGVDIAVRPGEVVAVAGDNGSGKSTLCLVLVGLLRPDHGEVLLDGEPLDAPRPATVQLLQQFAGDQVVAPMVAADVAFGPESLGLPEAAVDTRVGESLARVGLAGYEQRDVETLSGGELAGLALAGALAVQPRFLLVDEPTAHLDPASAGRFVALLRLLADQGMGVLLVTHRLDEARVADRLLLLNGGQVAACGSPRNLLYDDNLLRSCALEPPPVVVAARTRLGVQRARECAPLTADEILEAGCPSSV